MARQVVGAVVVAVGRGPCQVASEERGDDFVDVDGAVLQEGVLAGEKVAIENDELL